MRIRWIVAAVVILCIIGAILFERGSQFSEVATIGKDAEGFQSIRDRFLELARKKGAIYAYRVLERAPLPTGVDLHLMGHAVGDVLYEQKGVEGMADCTQEFRNACSHSIVIHALYEFGDGVIPKVRDACMKAPGGPGAYTMCFHGFGHGVFTYFARDLKKTIDYCRRTGTPEHQNREYTECIGGAIMEIADPGPGIGGDEIALDVARAKYLTDPLAPCMSPIIPEDVKGICLTYLTPRLWIRAGIDLGKPDPSRFTEAFSFCNKIPANRMYLRDICYGGFGKEFLTLAASRDVRHVDAQSDESLQTVGRWCSLAGNAEGEGACVSDAVAGLFWGGENNPDGSFRFCSVLESHPGDTCFARLAREIHDYTSGDREKALCARLPDSVQAVCRKTP